MGSNGSPPSQAHHEPPYTKEASSSSPLPAYSSPLGVQRGKAEGVNDDEEVREEAEGMDFEDFELSEAEMRSTWGEYSAQNEVLHHIVSLFTMFRSPPSPSWCNGTEPQHISRLIPSPQSTALLTPPQEYRSPPPTHTRESSSSKIRSSSPPPDTLIGDGSDGMEVLQDEDAMEEDVRRRYEDANRLLAELEVVRRERWGEGG